MKKKFAPALLWVLLSTLTFTYFLQTPIDANALTRSYTAQCVRSSPGYMYVKHRKAVFYATNFRVETNCTAKRAGYVYFVGGVVCQNGYIWFINRNNSRGWCRVRRVVVY